MMKKEVGAQILDFNKEFLDLFIMAKDNNSEISSSSSQVITTDLFKLSNGEFQETVNDMSSELYNLHVTLKSLKKENTRIKNANFLLFDGNNLLDTQLLDYENAKKDFLTAKDDFLRILKREEILKRQLNLEKGQLLNRRNLGI
ncbi:hypothetical protein AgCh_018299 [Apium graveolens]